MTSFRHDISGGQGNLIRDSFQSPDFIAGVRGWQVKKNGDVEFNSGTFRGVVNGGEFKGTDFDVNPDGIFFYSDTPALGNLLVSITRAAGNDPYGNNYIPGITVYGPSGAFVILEDNGAEAAIVLVGAGLVHSTTPTQIFGNAVFPGAANELSELILTSGKENNLDDAALQLFSERADGSAAAAAKIEFGGTIAITLTKTEIDVSVDIVRDGWTIAVLDAGWTQNATNPVRYRRLPDGNVQWTGIATHAGFTTTQTLISALNPAYTPVQSQELPAGIGTNNATGIAVSSSGVVQCRVNMTGNTTTTCNPQGSYPLD